MVSSARLLALSAAAIAATFRGACAFGLHSSALALKAPRSRMAAVASTTTMASAAEEHPKIVIAGAGLHGAALVSGFVRVSIQP